MNDRVTLRLCNHNQGISQMQRHSRMKMYVSLPEVLDKPSSKTQTTLLFRAPTNMATKN